MLTLQRTVGNEAVLRLLSTTKSVSSSGGQRIQRATLYRGMQASAPNGTTPLLGNESYGLGARDADVTLTGDKVTSGGMSTSNAAAAVPGFTVSQSYTGGTHNTTQTTKQAFRWKWSIDTGSLPTTLTTLNDHGSHVLVKPANTTTTLSDYRAALQSTQASWARSDPP